MTLPKMLLKKEEEVIFRLRALFEQFGYKKFKMSKFEEYDFYAENRSFLSSENILTFSGLDGKLLALKPDVTLSIVKNTKGNYENPERVYYNENVYRVRKGAGEFKEIMQVGLEYIGEVDRYATLEVIRLAQKSLEIVSDDYIMDISHMGFVMGLIEELGLSNSQNEALLKGISEKNTHSIQTLCKQYDVKKEMIGALVSMASLYGSMEESLQKAKLLCLNEKMEQALEELEVVFSVLKANGGSEKLKLDFSVVNGMDYYTGIIFQGFINGVPSSILSGGRYDNLVRKLGKNSDAIGFAVYLDLLERYESQQKEYDTDILLLYEENTDTAALLKAVEMLTDNGQSVMVQRQNNQTVKYRQLWSMKERGLEIIAEND
ncbi:ATP phosphoribosyltransferase regulatory subunit [Anaerotignum neopropionicum]|uniref:ATP phosphoribosyltransferase regulatory subunit n=1 Tax=Anaerotignum neopropionicum TaxID=36847 RepID=A0A136WG24_9FIRM|nr:ATP phosphoribosyltransferase regulatory subunit [Anaerotignum neopropionicum]KXL53481.1 ATP phosphoribosyltransferase regulatory subunit [Anaerotignum neopropionicum]